MLKVLGRLFTTYTHLLSLIHTAVDCGPLDNPENGRVEVFNTTLGSPADYRCDQGHELEGVDRRVCVETGEWTDDAPVCNRKETYSQILW